MSHEPHQPKRTGHAVLHRVPLKRRMDPSHQRALLAVGVGFSTLVIVTLYAASFRYQRALTEDTKDLPRWDVLKSDVLSELEPLRQKADAIMNARATLNAVMGAKAVQAESIAIMKAKLESATSTKTK